MTDQAVVLGAGIVGLAAAAALAEQFSTVTVVERDRLPDGPLDRRGVPQGRHLHSLLSRGSQIFEELLPGFLAELVGAGAVVLDDDHLGRIHWCIGPYTFNRTDRLTNPAALTTYQASRPFVEFHLRRRVEALPNVTFLDGREVGEYLAAQPDRITAVTINDRESGTTETLTSDLIIDATGRATRTPLLLERLGYPRPLQRTFSADGVYYSQRIVIPDQNSFGERLVLVLPEGKAQRGGLVACEDDTWMLTIAGRSTDLGHPPTDFGDMLALAQDFTPGHIQPALHHAQPLTDVSTYRYPGGIWRRYDHMPRYPDGLLVIGDALCCLDPINGQGMTIAALQADALRTQIRHTNPLDPQAFYAAVTAIIKPVWATNAEQASGSAASGSTTSLSQRATQWTRRKILQAAAHDIAVTERLSRVAHFVDPPQRLLEPSFLTRVASANTRRRKASRLT